MKLFLNILLCTIPYIGFAQKVDHDDKTDMVTIDGIQSFKIDRIGCGWNMEDCHFDVFDLAGNKVIRINYHTFNSPAETSSGNPKGRVEYFEFVFLESKTKAEIKANVIKEVKVAKLIVKNNLFREGKLDTKAVDEFVLVHGTNFSSRVRF